MRRELQKLREQLHVMHEAQVKSSGSLCSDAGCTDTEIFHSAGDLANIEVQYYSVPRDMNGLY